MKNKPNYSLEDIHIGQPFLKTAVHTHQLSEEAFTGMVSTLKLALSKTSDEISTNFLTVAQVAEKLKVSRPTVYQLFKQGRLPKIKFGKSTRIPERAVRKLESEISVIGEV